MMDGSVRTVMREVSVKTLKAASTPVGGDKLGNDW